MALLHKIGQSDSESVYDAYAQKPSEGTIAKYKMPDDSPTRRSLPTLFWTNCCLTAMPNRTSPHSARPMQTPISAR